MIFSKNKTAQDQKVKMTVDELSEAIITLSHDNNTPFNSEGLKALYKNITMHDENAYIFVTFEYTSFSLWIWWFMCEKFYRTDKVIHDKLLCSFDNEIKQYYNFLIQGKPNDELDITHYYNIRYKTYYDFFNSQNPEQLEISFRYHIERASLGEFVDKSISFPLDTMLLLPVIEFQLFTKPFVLNLISDINKMLRENIIIYY